MSLYGKKHRLSRLFSRDRILIMAMDHGIPMGEQKGLFDIEELIRKTYRDIDAVILNKGTVDTLDFKVLNRVELIYKLNGITSRAPNPYDLVMFTSVEEAASYDPSALSYELYIGAEQEQRRVEELSRVLREASRFDIPVISHIYPNAEKKDPDIISHCIRLGLEIGTDVIKTFYFPDMKDQVLRTRKPILIAGGDRMSSPEDVFKYVDSAMDSGVKGIAMGRNLWGWNERTVEVVEKVGKIVHSRKK
jgi:DhnA family fructose-bisphosphate aldolase class Ia